jgi:prepilin peptidase CpaA
VDITPTFGLVAFLVGVGLYTLAAAFTDLRTRRIPNWLTVSAFALGLVYQFAFHGLAGLGNGLAGFAIGFGLLFVLWMVGGGGGGDVKLMGGLGVWLGFRLTLLVLASTTVLVVLGTSAVVLWSMVARGARGTRQRYVAKRAGEPTTAGGRRNGESPEQRQNRRVMAFAVPVALATWMVVAWKLPTLAEANAPLPPHVHVATETEADR